MRRKAIIGILAMCISIGIIGCGKEKAVYYSEIKDKESSTSSKNEKTDEKDSDSLNLYNKTTVENDEATKENSPANFAGGVGIVRDARKLYWALGNCVYCCDLDGVNRQILYTVSPESESEFVALNSAFVVGNKIYFRQAKYVSSKLDSSSIYRMSKDGSGVELVYEQGDGFTCRIVNDKIIVNVGTLLDLDGNYIKTIYDMQVAAASTLNATDEYAYFANSGRITGDGDAVYRLNLGDGQLDRIFDGYVINMALDENEEWLYFLNDGVLYKMRTDGSELQALTDIAGSDLNVYNGWIYFNGRSDTDEDAKLYKISTEGGEPTSVVDESVHDLTILDNHIYFTRHQDESEDKMLNKDIYRCELDGQNNELFFDVSDPSGN